MAEPVPMSPELLQFLEYHARQQQDEAEQAKAAVAAHRMAYITRRQALLATSTFTRPVTL